MTDMTPQRKSRQLQLFDGKITTTVCRVSAAQNINCAHLCLIKSVKKATRMSAKAKSPRENNFPERKTVESRMNGRSPEAEIHKSTDLKLSEKLTLPNIKPTLSRTIPIVPSLDPTENRFSIEVNEMKKVQEKPRRVLPCLPPIVQEILRWSIHPQEVLRGAASVSHLFNLPTIQEESLPSVQPTKKVARPRVKRILPSVPPTENRTLPTSNLPNVARQPLQSFRAEFRNRMLPSLPTIKERASPMLPEVELPDENKESMQNEASQDPVCQPTEQAAGPSEEELWIIKKQKKKQRRHKHKKNRKKTSLQPAEKEEAMVELKSINRDNLQNSESTSAQELPKSQSGKGSTADHAREGETLLSAQRKKKRTKKSRQLEKNETSTALKPTTEASPPTKTRTQAGLKCREHEEFLIDYPKVNRTRLSLLSADSYVWLDLKMKGSEELPRLRAKLARRSETMFQSPEKERNSSPPNMKSVLGSPQTIQEPQMPKPPSSPKPAVTRVCRTVNRTLEKITSTEESMIPKPPSTPKPNVTRVRPTMYRPLPSISPIQATMVPKPPSTPKRVLSARPIAIVRRARPTENRPLPNIQPVVEQTAPSLDSSSQQSLVKFPLPSVQPEEKNYRSAPDPVKPTAEANIDPL